MPLMRTPDGDDELEIVPAGVAALQALGYELVDDVEAYDPGDFTVDEVLNHLEGLTPVGRAAVLEAEQHGKARKGILEAESLI